MTPVLGFMCLVLVDSFLHNTYASSPTVYYTYKIYTWKKKEKQKERQIRALKEDCENKLKCNAAVGLEAINCARRCMSASCFNELYGPDPLEEGEIDVRYNSFKGCIVEKVINRQ